MKRIMWHCAILLLAVFCVSFPAVAWGNPNPTPFPTPEWQKMALRREIAAQIDKALGGSGVAYVPPTASGSFFISGAGYSAQVEIEEQAAGDAAWQGNYTTISGFAFKGDTGFAIWGLKPPNQPASLQIQPVGTWYRPPLSY